MVVGDVAPAIKLTDTMEWGFAEEDFKFMMKLEPEGCLVALDDAKLIGLTTTIRFENLGWIGNVIVEAEYREKGIGSIIVQRAISYLESIGATSIGLYSYVDTVPFYERLGFKRDKTFIYLVGSGAEVSEIGAVKPMGDKDFKKAVELDRDCIGVSREKLLRGIFSRSRNLCYVAFEGGDLLGFVMARGSSDAVEVGPLICKGSEDEAVDLLNVLLRRFIGFDAYIGVPEDKFKTVSTLRTLKFREKFKVVRMYYGAIPRDKGCMLAIESLERG